MAEDKQKVNRTQVLTFPKGDREQIIYSEPRRLFVKRYLTAKGVREVNAGYITPEEADRKYGKNRYRLNPNARPIRKIFHKVEAKHKIHLDMIYPKNGVLGRDAASNDGSPV